MNVLSSFMAVVIWEGDNLIQEPSWEKQPLEINLLGWKLGAARGWHRDEDWDTGTEIWMQHPCVQPCLPHPHEYSQGWKINLIIHLQGTLPAAHVFKLLTQDLVMDWAMLAMRFVITIQWNREKNLYSKCRTMNGTSVMVPEVTYTVFCYI